MLMGKRFPQNVKDIRMVTEELLWEVIAESGGDEAMNVLTEKGSESKRAKLWIECHVAPTFLMMQNEMNSHKEEWSS